MALLDSQFGEGKTKTLRDLPRVREHICKGALPQRPLRPSPKFTVYTPSARFPCCGKPDCQLSSGECLKSALMSSTWIVLGVRNMGVLCIQAPVLLWFQGTIKRQPFAGLHLETSPMLPGDCPVRKFKASLTARALRQTPGSTWTNAKAFRAFATNMRPAVLIGMPPQTRSSEENYILLSFQLSHLDRTCKCHRFANL